MGLVRDTTLNKLLQAAPVGAGVSAFAGHITGSEMEQQLRCTAQRMLRLSLGR